jgi:hypothetical protein
MKHISGIVKFGSLVLSVIFLIGCAKVPEKELADSKAALEAARVAGADQFASEFFMAANDSFKAAMDEISKQNGQNSFVRNYDKAKNLLNSCIKLAKDATQSVQENKEEIRLQTQKQIEQIGQLIKEAKDLVAKAPKKTDKKLMAGLQNELRAVESMFAETNNLMNNNILIAARDRSAQCMEKAVVVNANIKNSIEKSPAPKKSKKK